MNKLLLFLTIVVLMFVLGCSLDKNINLVSDSDNLQKVVIGTTNQEISALIWIAEHQGYFVENGLNVVIKEIPSGASGFDDVLNGDLDIATATEFVAVKKSFENNSEINKFKIFGAISHHKNIKMISNIGSGIFTPQDLKGKKIGLNKGTNTEFYLDFFLKDNNISLSDVEIINLKPSEMFDSFSNNNVDSVVVWEPHVFNIQEKLNKDVNVWEIQDKQDAYWLLVTRSSFIASNPKLIDIFLSSLSQAETFLNNNILKSKEIIMQRLNFNDKYFESVWDNSNYDLFLSQSLLLSMEKESRWAIRNGLTNTKEIPNYLDYIYFDSLEKINPDAITIIRR